LDPLWSHRHQLGEQGGTRGHRHKALGEALAAALHLGLGPAGFGHTGFQKLHLGTDAPQPRQGFRELLLPQGQPQGQEKHQGHES